MGLAVCKSHVHSLPVYNKFYKQRSLTAPSKLASLALLYLSYPDIINNHSTNLAQQQPNNPWRYLQTIWNKTRNRILKYVKLSANIPSSYRQTLHQSMKLSASSPWSYQQVINAKLSQHNSKHSISYYY